MKDPLIYLEKGIFERQEYETWADACRKHGVECRIEDVKTILGQNEDPDRCWLWGSVEAHKIVPFRNSAINWNVYTDIFPRKFVPKHLFLNEEPEYKQLGEIYQDEQTMFVKSVTGDKYISGGEYRACDLSIPKCDPRSLNWVSISPLKDIGQEIRFIVHQGKIISGARYITDEEKIVHACHYKGHRIDCRSTLDAAQFFLMQCERYIEHADETFTMDLVWDREASIYKILEFNSFYSAGIYGNDVEPIVKSIADRK